MTDLSPAAQAVMIAATNGNTNVVNDPVYRQCIAAALRAAADQVVPLRNAPKIPFDAKRPTVEWHVWDAKQRARADLLAIAAEAESILDHPRFRAALADEPAAPKSREWPSDEELLDLHDWMADEWAANHDAELPLSQYARAVLARWGADQELKACEEWLPSDLTINGESLRDVRRPKPPSLAEEALAALNEIEDRYAGPSTQEILVRRALERLQELEKGNE